MTQIANLYRQSQMAVHETSTELIQENHQPWWLNFACTSADALHSTIVEHIDALSGIKPLLPWLKRKFSGNAVSERIRDAHAARKMKQWSS